MIGEKPLEVFQLLVKEEKSLTFLPGEASGLFVTVDGAGGDDQLAQPEDDRNSAARHKDSRLHTAYASAQLQSRLLATYHAARTSMEEQGVNTLYLALGMLSWSEEDNSEQFCRAPLILVPVKLEASQVKPVDALGAIVRGQQAVVVGDSKQLPPTSFFDSLVGSDDAEPDDDATAASDIESVLGLFCSRGAHQRMLQWHYRSRHESLIAVSNHLFYDDRLVVFPSPDLDRKKLGLVYRRLENAPYERSRTRTNPVEAKAVAAAVMAHALGQLRFPREQRETLGVAAFSAAQMDAILNQVELLRRQDSSCEEFFSYPPHEPFFVKNLENVQGDERDVIFISVGYGRTVEGYLAMSFGPLNRVGGERRLNVLISRARKRCEVFTTLSADDIDLSKTSSVGVVALKTFLNYAQTGQMDVPEPALRRAAFQQYRGQPLPGGRTGHTGAKRLKWLRRRPAAMLTDSLPKKALLRAAYLRSDQLCSLEVPPDDRLRTPARSIEEALNAEQAALVRKACFEFLTAAANFYGVSRPQVRVLAARPLPVRESRWAVELFGDYHLEKKLIRVWMRTAVQKRVTSIGTFLSTLCHEFCHHLDCERFGFGDTPHTRGFYERAAALYHHARSTPTKPLFRVPLAKWPLEDRLATHESRWVMPAFEACARAPRRLRATATISAADDTCRLRQTGSWMPTPKIKARFIEPMLLQRTEKLPEGASWLYELKLDGFRAEAIKSGRRVHFRSRNDKDFNARYPAIVQALAAMPDETVIDGEIVALDESGRPSFNALQNHAASTASLFHYVFDVMILAGKDVMNEPLSVRRELLQERVRANLGEQVRESPELEPGLPDLIRSVKAHGLEGLVAKRRDSRYEPGQRSGAWQKMRVNRGQAFVIGGYTQGTKNFDATVFGYYAGGKLIFAGRTRNGFTPSSREQLFKRFGPLAVDKCPFASLPEAKSGRWGEGADR